MARYGNIQINPPAVVPKRIPRITRNIYWTNRSEELPGHHERQQQHQQSTQDLPPLAPQTTSGAVPSSSKGDDGAPITTADIVFAITSIYDDAETLIQHLFDLLRSARDDNDLQSELIDLLGIEQFELVGKILLSRRKLISDFECARQEVAQTTELERLLV
ncbi:unnamed protein product [Gongylonema pulchrum]|uniref:Helicase_PWI domain-containing protein n=1 Tax=Gongylonema pulchrum TaxID=637853 RepID=A0A183E503_9BILA|nr:unnamed protein product [Gongylonema pulchrum]